MQVTWLMTVILSQLRSLRLLYFRAVWWRRLRLDLLIRCLWRQGLSGNGGHGEEEHADGTDVLPKVLMMACQCRWETGFYVVLAVRATNDHRGRQDATGELADRHVTRSQARALVRAMRTAARRYQNCSTGSAQMAGNWRAFKISAMEVTDLRTGKRPGCSRYTPSSGPQRKQRPQEDRKATAVTTVPFAH